MPDAQGGIRLRGRGGSSLDGTRVLASGRGRSGFTIGPRGASATGAAAPRVPTPTPAGRNRIRRRTRPPIARTRLRGPSATPSRCRPPRSRPLSPDVCEPQGATLDNREKREVLRCALEQPPGAGRTYVDSAEPLRLARDLVLKEVERLVRSDLQAPPAVRAHEPDRAEPDLARDRVTDLAAFPQPARLLVRSGPRRR